MTLMEALSCGVPCVTTDVGDAALVVGATGRVVPPADPEGLAAAALALLTLDPVARQAMGAQARARVVEEYSLTATLGRYAALYENLLSVR